MDRVRCASCGKREGNPSDPVGVFVTEGFSADGSFSLCGRCETEYLRLPDEERERAKYGFLAASESNPSELRCDPGCEAAVAALYRKRSESGPLCPGCDEPVSGSVGGVFSGIGPDGRQTPGVAICGRCRDRISVMTAVTRGKELSQFMRRYLRNQRLYDVSQDLLNGLVAERLPGPSGSDN